MAGNIYKILGQRIREERQRTGLTQEDLGEKSGFSGAYIAHIERATKHPTLESIDRIAVSLGLSASRLLDPGPRAGRKEEDGYAYQFARITRGKTSAQKRSLLQIVRAAADLIR